MWRRLVDAGLAVLQALAVLIIVALILLLSDRGSLNPVITGEDDAD